MHLSREAGWFDDGTGNALYVRANQRYADDDPAVKAVPHIFDKITDDTPPKAAVQKAKAQAKAEPAASDG